MSESQSYLISDSLELFTRQRSGFDHKSRRFCRTKHHSRFSDAEKSKGIQVKNDDRLISKYMCMMYIHVFARTPLIDSLLRSTYTFLEHLTVFAYFRNLWFNARQWIRFRANHARQSTQPLPDNHVFLHRDARAYKRPDRKGYTNT